MLFFIINNGIQMRFFWKELLACESGAIQKLLNQGYKVVNAIVEKRVRLKCGQTENVKS